STLPSTRARPSGNASDSAITVIVSSAAHGLRNTRPMLATRLYRWWSNQVPSGDGWRIGAAARGSAIGQVLRRDVVHQRTVVEHQHALLHALDQAQVVAGDQHAGAALGQRGEQRHDFGRQGRVEVAGR